jgi:hypothetical protein
MVNITDASNNTKRDFNFINFCSRLITNQLLRITECIYLLIYLVFLLKLLCRQTPKTDK